MGCHEQQSPVNSAPDTGAGAADGQASPAPPDQTQSQMMPYENPRQRGCAAGAMPNSAASRPRGRRMAFLDLIQHGTGGSRTGIAATGVFCLVGY